MSSSNKLKNWNQKSQNDIVSKGMCQSVFNQLTHNTISFIGPFWHDVIGPYRFIMKRTMFPSRLLCSGDSLTTYKPIILYYVQSQICGEFIKGKSWVQPFKKLKFSRKVITFYCYWLWIQWIFLTIEVTRKPSKIGTNSSFWLNLPCLPLPTLVSVI